MEDDPFALVEAMTIAGFATGCEQGYLYIRGEYPLATERLEHAIDRRARARVPGRRHPGRRRRASTSRSGAAAAPTSAAKRPRSSTRSRATAASRATSRRSPSKSGLFGKPTVINNVETLVNVLADRARGGAAFAAIGTERVDRPPALLPVGARAAARRLRGAVRRDAAAS